MHVQPLLRGDRERAHLAVPDVRQRRRHHAEHHLHLAAQKIGPRHRLAAIGHVHQIDAGHLLEQLAGDMQRRRIAARRHVDLAGIGFRIGDELGHGLRRKRRMNLHHQRNAADQRHRHGVAHEAEAEIVEQRRIDAVRRHAEQQRVTVRRRAHDRFGCDVSARARPVVDHDRLADPVRQPLADHAGDDVRRAAGADLHDEAHRLCRIGLRECRTRQSGKRRSARHELQDLPARNCHPAALVDAGKHPTFVGAAE